MSFELKQMTKGHMGFWMHLSALIFLLIGVASTQWFEHSTTGCIEGLYTSCCPVPAVGGALVCGKIHRTSEDQSNAQILAALAVPVAFMTTLGGALGLYQITESVIESTPLRWVRGVLTAAGLSFAVSAWTLMYKSRDQHIEDDVIEVKYATWIFLTGWVLMAAEFLMAQCAIPALNSDDYDRMS